MKKVLLLVLAATMAALMMVGCQKEDDLHLSYNYAYLVDGPTFNKAIPNKAKTILFVYGDDKTTSGVLLSTEASPNPIYGNLVGSTWMVSTVAETMFTDANCAQMFRRIGHQIFEDIDLGSGFNTSRATDMSQMFLGCDPTAGLDLSSFNTEQVTTMNGMFAWCLASEIDLSSFNTARVTDMNSMFNLCSELEHLDLSSFNTEQVTDMNSMFANCERLEELDLSSFNTEQVTGMSEMFSHCHALTSLDLSSFRTEQVTDMTSMFANCYELTYLNLLQFNLDNVDPYLLVTMCDQMSKNSKNCTIVCSAATKATMEAYCYLSNKVAYTWELHD